MDREKFDLEIITERRLKSIEATIAPIGADTAKALGEKLFPYHDHPWRQVYFDFIAAHSGSTFYHATTTDPAEVLYCDEEGKGIWYIPTSGVGPLQPRELAMMREIVSKLRRG